MFGNARRIVTFHDNAPRDLHCETHRGATDRRTELLAELQANEHDKFAAHLYRSRRGIPVSLSTRRQERQADRALRHLDAFGVAESMGFKGEFRQWEHLLRIGD